MQIVQRGAEAILYLEDRDGKKVLVKDRVPKGYRIRQLDERIRIQRTRHEESLLLKARRAGVSTPNVLEAGESRLVMEWISGSKLKDSLNGMEKAQRMGIYRLIGESIARLHGSGIIHGDLTTSNMIFKEVVQECGTEERRRHQDRRRQESPSSSETPSGKGTTFTPEARLYIIDFGLGKISGKIEDQAVDLYLLYEALKSTHLKLMDEAWKNILKAYKQNYAKSNEVLARILKIEKRRRYKGE